ncbi:LysR family transcriptional regulator [Pseudomonas urmiensis]|uniref:LysR family transcriptional regulator n=1 Tax=Pseudomonas urmiensis TaxID=2745493 RepID=A0ABW8NSV4_9PSED
MARDKFSDLVVFLAVAQEGNFTRAAAKLRVTQPAVSYAVRQLEFRLGVQLVHRRSRNVTLTEDGQRLFDRVAPEISGIDAELDALSDLRDHPIGKIRITAIDYAVRSTLWPKLVNFLPQYPDIQVELVSEYASVDIAAQGYDAGVRFGEALAQDMISVRIAPDIKNTVVGSASYFSSHAIPSTPKDLIDHRCINLRLATHGGLYEWEFSKGDQSINTRVDGPVIFNNAYDILEAVRAGFGLGYLPQDLVEDDVASGRLVSVLEDWCPTWSGLHLYYPNRRQPSRAMALLIQALRQQS